MTWLYAKFAGIAATVATILGLLAVVYGKGRTDAATATLKDRLAAANTARKIENETSRLSDRDVDARLNKWMRDKR